MHFNGGTIRWFPVDPSENKSQVNITVVQSYYWMFPGITCSNNVPATTLGRSQEATNLTCVADCTSDGDYSKNPVNTLTDCVSTSTTARLLISERSVNMTLKADAHFYASNVGNAWRSLNYPLQYLLDWSITFLIDLRRRPDGLINTPPTVHIISPQYVIVNQITQIKIPVSDANDGDDVRCRWSRYTSGYRRRRRAENEEVKHVREKRVIKTCLLDCLTVCEKDCPCLCTSCLLTTCVLSNTYCLQSVCGPLTNTTRTTKTTTTTTFNAALTTTVDTPGPLKSTSSFPSRQAIDECGGVCYPDSLPTNTTLSDCTISFRGLIANTWYAVAIQVRIQIRHKSCSFSALLT